MHGEIPGLKLELSERSKERAFKKYISDTKNRIESELSNLIVKISGLKIHEKLKYALLSDGKRLRPLMLILSAQSVGGSLEDSVPLALAMESLHTATLVHDDIIDHDRVRRGLPAVYEKWSVNDAILVGDALISLAINLAADYGKEVLKITSEAGLALCDGEYIDISLNSIEISESQYLEKIRKKSASLFQAATKCGAISGGGSDFEVGLLGIFGEYFGVAYQLSDDLFDIASPTEAIPKDLKERRLSLPLLHLYRSSSSHGKSILKKDLRSLSGNTHTAHAKKLALERTLRNLKAKGSYRYCRSKIDDCIDQSISALELLADTSFKSHLIQMAMLLRKNAHIS